jgi:hypothetical protein
VATPTVSSSTSLPAVVRETRPCPGCLGSGRCWVCLADGCAKCERSGRCTYCAPVVPPLPSQRAPAVAEPAPASPHVVQFYDSELVLAECVAAYVAPALLGGGAAVVVATPSHRQAVERELAWAGVPLTSVLATGQYVALDAVTTLASLLVGGHPDADRFSSVIGGVISAAAHHGPVRAYGEMVALLQAEGRTSAALALEELWNDLAVAQPFELLCSYPKRVFDNEHGHADVRSVYDRHTHVVSGRAAYARGLAG